LAKKCSRVFVLFPLAAFVHALSVEHMACGHRKPSSRASPGRDHLPCLLYHASTCCQLPFICCTAWFAQSMSPFRSMPIVDAVAFPNVWSTSGDAKLPTVKALCQ
jgi:hypothetical protein